MSFSACETAIRQMLMLDNDLLIVKIVYCAYFANLLPGRPPVWLMILGPPGSGKTQLMNFFDSNVKTVSRSSISPAAFLSGYDDAESLLTADMHEKILMVKDMSTMIEGQKEIVGKVMSVLRCVYDGDYSVHTGKGYQEWTNKKLGFIGACTQAIESYMQFQSALGERFIYVKMRGQNEMDILDRMLTGTSTKSKQENQIRQVTNIMIDTFPLAIAQVSKVHRSVLDTLKMAAISMARMRSVVPRDSYRKEVINEPTIESPTRIFEQLLRMCLIATFFGVTEDEQHAMLRRFVYDSIAKDREVILKLVAENPGCQLKDVADAVNLSKSVTGRKIQDMKILKILDVSPANKLTVREKFINDAILEWSK